MTALDAILRTEDEDYNDLEAWQFLIDRGIVWQLQGSYGRRARRLIEAGECLPYPREKA